MSIIGVKQTKRGIETVQFREKLWSNNEARELIKAYKQSIHMFTDHTIKIFEAWKYVSDILASNSISKSAKECDKKFRNLKNTFQRVYSDSERSESSKYQWELYEDLKDVFEPGKTLLRRTKAIKNCSPPVIKIENENRLVKLLYKIRANEKPVETDSVTKDDVLYNNESSIDEERDLYEESNEELTDEEQNESSPNVFEVVVMESSQEAQKNLLDATQFKENTDENFEVDTSLNQSNKNGSDDIPPWFQLFMLQYESDAKLVQEKLSRIIQKQESQSKILEHLTKTVLMLEKRIT